MCVCSRGRCRFCRWYENACRPGRDYARHFDRIKCEDLICCSTVNRYWRALCKTIIVCRHRSFIQAYMSALRLRATTERIVYKFIVQWIRSNSIKEKEVEWETVDNICRARKRNGHRCTRRAMRGELVCWQHNSTASRIDP